MRFPKLGISLVPRGSVSQDISFSPEIRRCRCRIVRISYSALQWFSYADIVYAPESNPDKKVFRRFVVRRISYSVEHNVRAHVMQPGDDVTLFWLEPYDQTEYPVIEGVNIHDPFGDEVIPLREGQREV